MPPRILPKWISAWLAMVLAFGDAAVTAGETTVYHMSPVIRSVPGVLTHPWPRPGCPICDALDAMQDEISLLPAGTIVYVTFSSVSGKLIVLTRYESNGLGNQISITHKGFTHASSWIDEIKRGIPEASEGNRARLFAKMVGNRTGDDGKKAFYWDLTGAGANPRVLGLDDVSSLSGDSIFASLERWKRLNHSTVEPKSFCSFVEFPFDTTSMDQVFPEREKTKDGELLPQWEDARKKIFAGAEKYGFGMAKAPAKAAWKSKQEFLDQLVNSTDVILLACHAGNQTIVLPGESPIQVTVADIEGLKLKKKPFVFIRICESQAGDNALFAKSFIKAGARGVSINSGEIPPSDAAEDVISFFRGLVETKNIERAFQKFSEAQRLRSQLFTLRLSSDSTNPDC